MTQLTGTPRVRLALTILSTLCVLGGAPPLTPTSAAAPGDHAPTTTASRPRPIDRGALARLEERARASESDAVVIYQDGKLVAEWYFGKPRGPIETMSATKSIVSLAIGRLLDTGKLRSLELPVHELFPEWRQGRKQKITVRQLLNHTSGLQNERNTGVELYPSPDFVKLALAAELTDEPGTTFSYNNKAVNLLAAIVKVTAGKPLDEYLRDEIFTPMGITDFAWSTDRAGTPQCMAGFQARAEDLAKLGMMMLDGGVWQGRRILSASWIAESTRPSQAHMPTYGLLWWLIQDFRKLVADDEVIARWRAGGVSEDFVAKLLPLKDRLFTSKDDYLAAISKALGGIEAWESNTVMKGLPAGKYLPTPTVGFNANGYLGQYLVVIPAARIVAVRQRRYPDDEAKVEDRRLGFSDFPEMVRALVR